MCFAGAACLLVETMGLEVSSMRAMGPPQRAEAQWKALKGGSDQRSV